MAISCAVNEDLRKEREKYLSETENHVRIRDGSHGAAWSKDPDGNIIELSEVKAVV